MIIGKLRAKLLAYLRKRLHVPEMENSLQQLKLLGFEPKLVLDVGAYQGDFAAMSWRVWPRASLFCFEPLPLMTEKIQARFQSSHASSAQNLRVFPILLGAKRDCEVKLSIAATASSVLHEHHDQGFETLTMKTSLLDDVLLTDSTLQSPILLKLDVQGFELEVLKGAEQLLKQVEVVLLEVNLLDIHQAVPLMHELLAWLSEHQFVAYDLAGMTRRPLDNALWQMDLVMVRIDSRLRSDKRWNQ